MSTNTTPKWQSKQLGDLEMQILTLVWQKGKATVKDVFEILYPRRGLAYTTIMTVMSRLAVKGVLNQERAGIPYVYTAAVNQRQVVKELLDRIVDGVLSGQVEVIASYCLEKGKISQEEVGALKSLVNKG